MIRKEVADTEITELTHRLRTSVVNRPVRPQYRQDGRDGAKAVRPVLAR